MKKLLLVFLIAIVVFNFACKSQSKSLVILFSNDIHGTFQPKKFRSEGKLRLVGGMEAASHYINRLREIEKNVLLIDSGDIMTGSLAAQIKYKEVIGGVMPEFLNRLGYDIRCYGNHAFDRGQENAVGLERLTEFPVILANVVYKDSGELFASQPYHILEKGGIKVGVIAVMEENFLQEVSKKNTQGLAVLPIIPTLNSFVPELDKKSDLIVVLIHSKVVIGDKVAQEVPGIDIALVASEDGRFNEVNGVLVKSTIGHLKTLGFLKIEVKEDRIIDFEEKLIWLWADVDLNPAPDVSELVRKVEMSVDYDFNTVIGRSDFDYIAPKYESGENALGNWIADVMRWKTGAQIALQNSGGIRADIFTGPVTKRDIYELSPFCNTLVLFKLTGRQIKEILERDVERGRDSFQVSGLRYVYYPISARPLGERVWRLKVGRDIIVDRGELLSPEKTYTLTTNDYIAGQAKAKYFGFDIKDPVNTEFHLELILMEWLEKHKVLKTSLDGRITEVSLGNSSYSD